MSDRKINYLAENYKSNSTIEKLIQQNYRSPSGVIEIISPADSTFIKVDSEINFTLKIKLFEPYSILIYNNRFIKVFESETLSTESNKFNTGLSVGLYYWKMKSASRSQWCGKMYIVE